MATTKNWTLEARDDARMMAEHFLDAIIEQLLESCEASNDYNNDYKGGDEYHHLEHVDKEYSLSEAADLLDSLSYCEETDSGLWQGLEPRAAVSCQAAYTYGNAVSHEWGRIIAAINESEDVQVLLAAIANGDSEDDQDEEEARATLHEVVKNLIASF